MEDPSESMFIVSHYLKMVLASRACLEEWHAGTIIQHINDLLFNFFNFIVWLRITDGGSVPEMSIWSILLIKSDKNGVNILVEVSYHIIVVLSRRKQFVLHKLKNALCSTSPSQATQALNRLMVLNRWK